MKVIGRMWARKIGAMPVLGKPMLWWTLEEASKAHFMDDMFVLADNEQLAEIAQESDCHVILKDPAESVTLCRDGWDRCLHSHMLSRCGSLGDIKVFLSCNSCLMTSNILEDMFVKIMEDMVSDTILPVTKVDPYLMLENSKSGELFPFWVHHGLDRQEYPDLYQAGNTRMQHAERRGGIRLLYHEVLPEHILEPQSVEDINLAEYYLSLRLGGEIVLPNI